ncbi:hypothetical protein MMC21_006980 [Puttea exsequens]|nr:hypothetical protein [Puttea exsequens]
MGGGRSKKRKHSQFAHGQVDGQSNTSIGIAGTLAHLRNGEQPPNEGDREDLEKWTTVKRAGKKQKKTNYPSLVYSELHRLQSSVTLSQLQGLVLYCLADGTAQQFVSLRHHGMIQKAVVLFVPGLDKGMFDGSIRLEGDDLIDLSSIEPLQRHPKVDNAGSESTGDLIDFSEPRNAADGLSKVVVSREQNVTNGSVAKNVSNSTPAQPFSHPDEYLPTLLAPEKLSLPLRPLAESFTHVWPVKAPGDDRNSKVHSPLHAMLNTPLSKSQQEKDEERKMKGPRSPREGKSWTNKRTAITSFIASREELIDNEYVLHSAWLTTPEERSHEYQRRARNNQNTGWRDTAVEKLEDGTVADSDIQQGSVTAGRRILAMDCEMCKIEGGSMALTRISLVNWDGEVVMDEFVSPDEHIIDYLTPYSGITAEKLSGVRTKLRDIQDRLIKTITPKHILVGHSLNADLSALKLTHPFIVDTSIIYPHPRGPPMKSALKWLAQKYLSREIQKGHGTMGHDSIEDALACLDLLKQKCERGAQWGTSEATNESIFKRLKRSPRPGPLIDAGDGKTGAIVDHGSPERSFGTMASYSVGCTDDAGVVEGIKRTVLGDRDGSYIPGGGVDFTWARFQDLASMRGWLIDHRPGSSASQTPDPSPQALGAAVSQTVSHINTIRSFLPPCTLFIVYSGTGDPREMGRLQEIQRTYRREYHTLAKKWDELSVKWTDAEEQALKMACRKARVGMGLLMVT